MRKKNKLIYGVGINDADYEVRPTFDGVGIMCPIYRFWYNMFIRCYDKKYQARQPTYVECSICEEWLTFSNFKAWADNQNWQGKQLDKDIIMVGNKVYCAEYCAFVDKNTNVFVTDHGRDRGLWPIGVHLDRRSMKFQASCSNPFNKKRESLGAFFDPDAAHLAWKKRKHELALQLADLQDDDRVAAALRLRYA